VRARLAEHASDVLLNSPHADTELLCDLPVMHVSGREQEHLNLPPGQVPSFGRARARLAVISFLPHDHFPRYPAETP
jgi:hypothetical protein